MIIAVVVLVGLLALFVVLNKLNPGVVVATSQKLPAISANPRYDESGLVLDLELNHSQKPRYISSLQLDRAAAEAISLQPPTGFIAEPLPQDGKTDSDWVENWNREHVRFVGKLQIDPGTPLSLCFPATGRFDNTFVVKGQFTNGRSFGGSIGFFQAKVPGVVA